MLLLCAVLLPMLMAFACFAVGKTNQQMRNLFAVLTGFCELVLAVILLFGKDRNVQLGGICGLGVSFTLDGFRRIYLLVISFMWLMTLLFSGEYFSHYHNVDRYYFFNLMTLGATVGVFLAADLFTALVFFEVMSFTSYTWVIQEETKAATRAANTYLAVAVIGGLVALMGLFLLQNRFGTTEISRLYALSLESSDRATLYIAGGCVLFGFGAKAGMFPLHIWLPKAHPVAPAPASALLSGVLTKSGIFGILAISCNLFRGDPAWGILILVLGTVTMLLGAVLAIFSNDLKRTLACSSMSQIGFVLVGIGMMGLLGAEGTLAARGTLLHMVNHSLFKLVLFLCAGVVYMDLHQLDLNDIRGFGRKKPVLMIVFLLAAAGIGGVPLLNGYISKTLLHESIVEGAAVYGAWLKAVEWIFLFSGGLTVAYMTKLFVALFLEKHPERQTEFDANKKYMKPVSAAAIIVSAAVLPLLGLTANLSMNGIADLGTDFFRTGVLEHAINYFSLENLKGAAISLAIGAAVYLLFVRKVLMKNGRYIELWSKKLDLEELIYRPLLLRVLPSVLGFIASLFGENRLTKLLWQGSMRLGAGIGGLFGENRLTAPAAKAVFRVADVTGHAVCDILDAGVLGIRKTVLKESPLPDEDKSHKKLAYRIGRRADKAAVRRGRESEGEQRYASLFSRAYQTLRDTGRRITGNLSFALLMLCAAVCAVLAYLFFVH